MKIRFEKRAIKFLKTQPSNIRNQILSAINGLTLSPPTGDIKKMRGYKEDCFRLRVGSYRVIFKFDECSSVKILLVMNIGSRGDIYK